ncbi:hypothetical protein OBJ93_07050 [Empedobacter falsenii]
MRKILLMIISLTFFYSCNKEKDNNQLNEQEKFSKFLEKGKEEYVSQPNSIKSEEFLNSFKNKETKYLDSIGLIQNWSGIIQKINKTDLDNGALIEFDIENAITETEKQIFKVRYFIPLNTMHRDSVFMKISNLDEYSTIYFDGYFNYNDNSQIKREEDYFISNSNYFSDPKFIINIIDIWKKPLKSNYSSDFKKALKLNKEIFHLLNLYSNVQINKEDWKAKSKILANEEVKIENKLNKSEKYKIEKTKEQLSYFFLN